VIGGLPSRRFDFRSNTGVTAGYTAALSHTTLVDVRVSMRAW